MKIFEAASFIERPIDFLAFPKMNNFFRALGFLLLITTVFLAGCYTVPETGRRALILTSLSQESQLGADAFTEIKGEEKISTDAEATARVERVGRRIAQEAEEDLPGLDWEFVLFENDAINAFALPGGKVGVYTGLLDLAENDDQLAAVIGHEIAHVTARHGAERMSRSIALAVGGVGVGLATRDSEYQEAFMIAYGLGSTVGIELPYSRKAETEADHVGLLYAARAGYDPRESVTFWQNMQKASENRSQPLALLSTHPTDDRRIQDLQKMMPVALKEYEQTQRISHPAN